MSQQQLTQQECFPVALMLLLLLLRQPEPHPPSHELSLSQKNKPLSGIAAAASFVAPSAAAVLVPSRFHTQPPLLLLLPVDT
jgi:hypothetical protein